MSEVEEKINDEWRKIEIEWKKISQERHYNNTQWIIMEKELRKIAQEKELLERQKSYYNNKLEDLEKRIAKEAPDMKKHDNTIHHISFFKGVDITEQLAVKKRYKDLLKIFHPDNPNGDTYILQIINYQFNQIIEKGKKC